VAAETAGRLLHLHAHHTGRSSSRVAANTDDGPSKHVLPRHGSTGHRRRGHLTRDGLRRRGRGRSRARARL